MRNHKILLTTISVGILSVSLLNGCNSQTSSGSGRNSTDTKTESASPSQNSTVAQSQADSETRPVTLEMLKEQLQNLKTVIAKETYQSFSVSEDTKTEWNTFKQEYDKYVANLESNQQQITSFFQNLIQKEIDELDPIFSPQDRQDNLEKEAIQASLDEIETYLGEIENNLQFLEKELSDSTSNNNINQQKASSDFLLPLTFILVLVTFALVLFGEVLFALKDRKKLFKNSKTPLDSNVAEVAKNLPKIEQLIDELQKFKDELQKFKEIITPNRKSALSTSGIAPYNANSQQNNQIVAIQKSVESLPNFLTNNFQESTKNFNNIISVIEGLEQKIEDNAKVNHIEKLGGELARELQKLQTEWKKEIQTLVANGEQRENRGDIQKNTI